MSNLKNINLNTLLFVLIMFSSFGLFINGSGASFDFSNCPWSVSKVGDGFCDDADTTNVPGKGQKISEGIFCNSNIFLIQKLKGTKQKKELK